MAANRTKPTKKQVAAMMQVTASIMQGVKPECGALFEAQETIAQLLIENNCLPVQAKKVPVKK